MIGCMRMRCLKKTSMICYMRMSDPDYQIMSDGEIISKDLHTSNDDYIQSSESQVNLCICMGSSSCQKWLTSISIGSEVRRNRN